MYRENLKSVITIIKEDRENAEMLWMKLDNGKAKIKIGIIYMPQESDTKVATIRSNS